MQIYLTGEAVEFAKKFEEEAEGEEDDILNEREQSDLYFFLRMFQKDSVFRDMARAWLHCYSFAVANDDRIVMGGAMQVLCQHYLLSKEEEKNEPRETH